MAYDDTVLHDNIKLLSQLFLCLFLKPSVRSIDPEWLCAVTKEHRVKALYGWQSCAEITITKISITIVNDKISLS